MKAQWVPNISRTLCRTQRSSAFRRQVHALSQISKFFPVQFSGGSRFYCALGWPLVRREPSITGIKSVLQQKHWNCDLIRRFIYLRRNDTCIVPIYTGIRLWKRGHRPTWPLCAATSGPVDYGFRNFIWNMSTTFWVILLTNRQTGTHDAIP